MNNWSGYRRRSARELDTPRRSPKRKEPKQGWQRLDEIDPTLSPPISPTGRFALTCCNGWGKRLRPWMPSTGRLVWPRTPP